jgi:hypothetical protein
MRLRSLIPDEVSIRPSKTVSALVAIVIFAALYVGIWAISKSFGREMHFVGLIFGFFDICFSAAFIHAVIEGLSTRIHDTGLEQLRIFRNHRFVARSVLRWQDIEDVSQGDGFRFRFTGASKCIDLNLAYFAHMDEVIKFINENLPNACRRIPD